MMSCEANITMISEFCTLKVIIFLVFALTQQQNGKAPLGRTIMHVITSSTAFDFLNCYQGPSNNDGMIKKIGQKPLVVVLQIIKMHIKI